jgi:hypothetical protein
LVVVAAITYGMPRVLRPDMYLGERVLPGLADDLNRAFLLGLWGAVLLIVLGLIADAIVSSVDPRVRTSAPQAW